MTKKYIEQYAIAKGIVEMEPARVFTDGNDKLIHFVMLGMNAKFKKKQEANGHAYQRCVEHWLKIVHPDWGFSAIDGKSMKGIIKQIRENALVNSKPTTDMYILHSFIVLCEKLPEFYKGQDLKTLNSKFNSIIYEIKHGKKKDDFHSQTSANRAFSKYSQ